jgi:hypothetical protein
MRAKQFMLLCVVLFVSFNTQAETHKKNIISKTHTDIITFSNMKQISCVAETIYSEARGESLNGQLAVGATIMNRSKKILHQSPCKVVKQQYTQKRIPNEDKDEYHILAKNLLLGRLPNPIGNKDSFDSHVNKKHKRGSIRIGKHYFYQSLKEKKVNV